MEIAVTFILMLSVIGGAIQWGRHVKSKWLEALRFVAEQFDLELNEGSFWKAASATGIFNGQVLTIDTYTEGSGDNSTVYTRVRLLTDLPNELVLEAEGLGASLKKVFMGDDIKTADEVFDDRILIRGNKSDIAARMTAENRANVMDNVWGRKISVRNAEITFREAGYIRDPARLLEIVSSIIQLANGLENNDLNLPEGADPPESQTQRTMMALMHNMMSEGEPGVALNCAHQLLLNYPMQPEGQSAIEHILSKADPMQIEDVDDQRHWWRSNELSQHLLELLKTSDEVTQLAAIRMLEQEGTIQAVVPLLNVAEKWTGNSDNKKAAREAIKTIQERVGETEVGALSLVDEENQGQLTLVATVDTRGALSVTDAPQDASYLADAVPTNETSDLALDDSLQFDKT